MQRVISTVRARLAIFRSQSLEVPHRCNLEGRPILSGLNFRPSSSSSGDSEEELYPTYVPRTGESVEVKRARLLYQSRKRGMLENGLLLSTFASTYLRNLTSSQLDLYDDIINRPSNDWKLYYWMVGKEDTPPNYDNEVMDMLKSHARNEKLEDRSRQPDLTA